MKEMQRAVQPTDQADTPPQSGGNGDADADAAKPEISRQGACSPKAILGWGVGFCLLYGVAMAIATRVHWPESDICAFPPFQDPNNSAGVPPDYPNPRCPNPTRFNNDTGPYWYYWRSNNFVFYSQVTAWVFYVAHQLSTWYITFSAQQKLSSDRMETGGGSTLPKSEKYSSQLRGFNWWALGLNAGFCILHLFQTHFMGYDALAPSVHEMASQGSVILMLVVIIMMETDRRGMWFGQPNSLFLEAADVAKRYHGYIFSWAAIFTFWYHPMEGYLGHIFGTFHVMIIMLQGALAFTDAHLNRYWRMVLEAWVFLHAGVISTQTLPSTSWPMFLFGFGAIFVVTQLPGLPCMMKCHVAVRVVPAIIFAAIYVCTFYVVAQWTNAASGIFIPAALYGGALGFNVILMLCIVIGRRCCSDMCSRSANVRPVTTTGKSICLTFVALFIMGAVIACAIVSEVVIDRNDTLATLLVYGSMCLGVLMVFLVLMCALPRPRGEQRRSGCLPCCCWNLPKWCPGCCVNCTRAESSPKKPETKSQELPEIVAASSKAQPVAVAKAADPSTNE